MKDEGKQARYDPSYGHLSSVPYRISAGPKFGKKPLGHGGFRGIAIMDDGVTRHGRF